jgi:hypothetical protein
MRFQGRGADGSFERLFLAEAVGYFKNIKCFDFSLFRLSMFIRSMLMQICTSAPSTGIKPSEVM